MKKKVAFITRHAVPNYGSVLQTYATQTAIEKVGGEAVCINYVDTAELPKNVVNTRMSNSSWNKNALTRIVYNLTQKSVFDYAGKKFAEYTKQLIKLTHKEYHSVEELSADLPQADVYMTGSDQVWNIIAFNKIFPAYFLPFVPDDKKKIAYAASFGGKTVNENEKEDIKKWISRYDCVTIRENSGLKIADEMGVKAQQVLDPTFLLERDEWEKIIPQRKPTKKFVLVYQLQPNKAFEKYAKEFAKRKNMPLIRINPYYHHVFKTGKFICCPPIGEFLWHIKNCECFLTDSFHGTAFAINLNKQFVDVLPNKFSERNRSILELTGMENRIIESYDDFLTADIPINYNNVNKIISEERQKSLGILKEMIED